MLRLVFHVGGFTPVKVFVPRGSSEGGALDVF